MSDTLKSNSKDSGIFAAENNVFSGYEHFDADEAAIDALLSRISAEEDAGVDYDEIYCGIEAKAKSEGLCVFPKKSVKNKSEKTIKRIAQAALVIACACVVGLGVTSLALSVRGAGNSDEHLAYGDDPSPSANAVNPSELIKVEPTSAPNNDKFVTTSPDISSSVMVDLTPDPYGTPIPTKMAGMEERISLFTLNKITVSSELIPGGLPDYMYTRYPSRDLRISSMGFDPAGNSIYYDCTVTPYSPYELGEGEVIIVTLKDGSLCAYWRINEDQFLYICMDGFTFDDAVSLLKSYLSME